MTIEIPGGHDATPAKTPAQTEYGVMIFSSENPYEWGGGLSIKLELTAQPIEPGSDLDQFWSEGEDRGGSSNQQRHHHSQRYRIMANSREEAIRKALALNQGVLTGDKPVTLEQPKKRGILSWLFKKT